MLSTRDPSIMQRGGVPVGKVHHEIKEGVDEDEAGTLIRKVAQALLPQPPAGGLRRGGTRSRRLAAWERGRVQVPGPLFHAFAWLCARFRGPHPAAAARARGSLPLGSPAWLHPPPRTPDSGSSCLRSARGQEVEYSSASASQGAEASCCARCSRWVCRWLSVPATAASMFSS